MGKMFFVTSPDAIRKGVEAKRFMRKMYEGLSITPPKKFLFKVRKEK